MQTQVKGKVFYNKTEGEYEYAKEFFAGRFHQKDDFILLDDLLLVEYIGIQEIVDIPQGVKIIANNAFGENCNIKKVFLPDGVEKIDDYAFSHCESLEEINFPDSLISIGDHSFAFCKNLVEISLPDNLKSIGFCAFQVTGIRKIVIPKTVNNLEICAFANSELEEATLPDNIKVIPAQLFAGASNLSKVNVPKKLKKIEKEAFSYTNVDVQPFLNAKKLTTIKDSAFEGVDWKDLTIPKHIKKIGDGTFANAISANSVTFEGNTKNISKNAFSYGNVAYIFKGKFKHSFTNSSLNLSYENTKWKFSYVKIKDADGYNIKIYDNTNHNKTKLLKNVNTRKNEFTFKCKLNQDVRFVVRPYKIIKGKKVYGRKSEETGIITKSAYKTWYEETYDEPWDGETIDDSSFDLY